MPVQMHHREPEAVLREEPESLPGRTGKAAQAEEARQRQDPDGGEEQEDSDTAETVMITTIKDTLMSQTEVAAVAGTAEAAVLPTANHTDAVAAVEADIPEAWRTALWQAVYAAETDTQPQPA